jgi:hypothetical protein
LTTIRVHPKPRPNVALYILTGLSLAALALYLGRAIASGELFWDMRIYSGAVEDFLRGESPYVRGYPEYKFVYPPFLIYLWSWLHPWVEETLVALYVLALVAFLRVPIRGLALSFLLTFGVFLCAEQPVGLALVTGNLTFFAHLLIIALWLRPALPFYTAAFYLAVIVTASIKPYFGAYLLLPLLAEPVTRAALVKAAVLALVVSGIWASQWLFTRDMFLAFLRAMDEQLVQDTASAFRGDIGHGFYRYAAMLTRTRELGIALHFAVVASLVAFWKRHAQPRLRDVPSESALVMRRYVPIILCILMNPRLKPYDYAVIHILIVNYLLLLEGASLRLGRFSIDPLLLLALAVNAAWLALLPLGKLKGVDFVWKTFSIYMPLLFTAYLLARSSQGRHLQERNTR